MELLKFFERILTYELLFIFSISQCNGQMKSTLYLNKFAQQVLKLLVYKFLISTYGVIGILHRSVNLQIFIFYLIKCCFLINKLFFNWNFKFLFSLLKKNNKFDSIFLRQTRYIKTISANQLWT